MNLTEQYYAKLEERQGFIENQSRLKSNLMKSINLVDSVTAQQLEVMDAGITALANTIGFVPTAPISQIAEAA